MSLAQDLAAIDALTAAFFSAFDNRTGAPALHLIDEVCIPQAVISKCVGDAPEVMSLAHFVAPRRVILTDGTLAEFSERESSHRTEIFGHIAQRWCTYEKSGRLNGVAFHATGTKALQFIKTASGWRISAVAWDGDQS